MTKLNILRIIDRKIELLETVMEKYADLDADLASVCLKHESYEIDTVIGDVIEVRNCEIHDRKCITLMEINYGANDVSTTLEVLKYVRDLIKFEYKSSLNIGGKHSLFKKT